MAIEVIALEGGQRDPARVWATELPFGMLAGWASLTCQGESADRERIMGIGVKASVGPFYASASLPKAKSGRYLPRTEREVEYMAPIYLLIWGTIIGVVGLATLLFFAMSALPTAAATVLAWIIAVAIIGGIPFGIAWYLVSAFVEGAGLRRKSTWTLAIIVGVGALGWAIVTWPILLLVIPAVIVGIILILGMVAIVGLIADRMDWI